MASAVNAHPDDPYPDHDGELIDLIQGEMAAWWEDDETRNAACRIADQLHRAGRLVPPPAGMSDCTCALADVSNVWDPDDFAYVRGETRGCLVHGTDEERREIAERKALAAERRRRDEAAQKAAREAP